MQNSTRDNVEGGIVDVRRISAEGVVPTAHHCGIVCGDVKDHIPGRVS